MAQTTIMIYHSVNLAVALSILPKCGCYPQPAGEIILCEKIPAKHKFAVVDLPAGSEIRIYGGIVGKAVVNFAKGCLINTKNVVNATNGF